MNSDVVAKQPQDADNQPKTAYEKLNALAHNIWWSWNQDVVGIFQTIDPILWRDLGHNPIALLKQFSPDELETRVLDLVLQTRIDQAYRRMREYMHSRPLKQKCLHGTFIFGHLCRHF